jgi:ERF superfamily
MSEENTTPLKTFGRVKMRRSKIIVSLAKALSAAQADFSLVTKSAYDADNSRSYSDLSDLKLATVKALAKNGLCVLQIPSTDLQARTATVTTVLLHESGEFMESDLELPAFDEDESGVLFDSRTIGAAISIGRRYSYQAILQLASEPDNKPIGDMATLRNESPRVNTAQAANFWQKSKAAGKTPEQITDYLTGVVGVRLTEDMPRDKYPAAMRWTEGEAIR